MLCWCRNLAYLMVLVGLFPWLSWRSFKTGRYRAGLRQKLLGFGSERRLGVGSDAPLIWMHGVSVGEIQLLAPLLERLRFKVPHARFAVSTTTDSGLALAGKLLPRDVRLFYFPFDFSWAVRRTLSELRPSLLVLVELELWPNLIDCASERDVPIAVVNGRLSERSHAGYKRFSWLARPMFGKLNLVAAQSESNAQRFRDCGASQHSIVTGSIKFDNVAFNRDCPQVSSLRELVGLLPQHRVLVAGSTQPPEEMAAVNAFVGLQQEFPLLKLVVVPRHPDRFGDVHRDLVLSGVRFIRRSELHRPKSARDWDVLLVDSVGELRWWWGLAEIALVGGSFGSRGGQNMLEPAAYGANVAFGPNTSNFRDIVELLLMGEGATRLHSIAELEPWLRRELTDPQLGRARGERARKIISDQQGALDRTVTALVGLLTGSRQSNDFSEEYPDVSAA